MKTVHKQVLALLLLLCACAQKTQTESDEPKMSTPKSGADLAGGKRYPVPPCCHPIMGYLSHVGAACCAQAAPRFFAPCYPCNVEHIPVSCSHNTK